MSHEIASLLRKAYSLAQTKSSDPLTKNGAILINSIGQQIGEGANCFPDKVCMSHERLQRPNKYDYLIHAEQNAIAQAARSGHSTANSTLVCPWAACSACARLIIQAGITKVIAHKALMQQSHNQWVDDIHKAHTMFREAQIEYIEYAGNVGDVEHMFNGKIWQP
ncbi:MAG TPA: deaminase [Gammaproteobacteria bacterium]|nr:deaminase [Gammaproteobacteria bacterium]